MGVTPYSLLGVEAVLPLGRETPSLRMERLTTEDNTRLHLLELEAQDERD